MISYVKGILAEKAKDRIVVESGMMGIGAGSFTAARGRGKDIYAPAGAGG